MARGDKTSDKDIAKKARSPKKTTKSSAETRRNNGIIKGLEQMKLTVENYLGKYRDKYMIINDEKVLTDYLSECLSTGIISIDTETDGLDPMLNNIAGVCIFTPGRKGAYIPLGHVDLETRELLPNQLPKDLVKDCFESLFEMSHIDVIMFNADFDIRVLRNQIGLKNIYCTWDCYIAAKLMNENEPSNALKKLHQKYVLHGKEDEFTFAELFNDIPFTYVPVETGYLYAAKDPEITYELYQFQREHLHYERDELPESRNGMNGVSWVFENIEMPCVNVVANMEDTGIQLDMDYAKQLSELYHQNLQEKLDLFYNICEDHHRAIECFKEAHPEVKLDDPINVGSPKQLATLLYDILKLKSPDKRNPRGTGEEVLSKIDNPICKAILAYRGVAKLLSTYIDKLPECANPNDGRVHGRFNQVGTHTGRFSSSDPNLQNIPSHNKDIRKMFTATQKEEYSLEVDNEFTIHCSTEVLTSDGWKPAANISKNDILVLEGDRKVQVLDIDGDSNLIHIKISDYL